MVIRAWKEESGGVIEESDTCAERGIWAASREGDIHTEADINTATRGVTYDPWRRTGQ